MGKKRELVDVHGWSVQPDYGDTLFVVTGQPDKRGKRPRLFLPLHFTSFLDEANRIMWQEMFRGAVFNPKRLHGSNDTLFIDSPGPVADIFYLSQILAPGMLVIIGTDHTDFLPSGAARGLPSEEWLKEHQSVLEHVLGSNQTFELLSNAAADFGKSFCLLEDDYYCLRQGEICSHINS